MGVQIRQKAPSSLIHRVADVVSSHRALACHLAYFGHNRSPKKFEARLYQSGPSRATKIGPCSQQTPQLQRYPSVSAHHHVIEQPYLNFFEQVE